MTVHSHQGKTYTELWAWWPVRADSGGWIWMATYYIRPGHLGQGYVLRRVEYLREVRGSDS